MLYKEKLETLLLKVFLPHAYETEHAFFFLASEIKSNMPAEAMFSLHLFVELWVESQRADVNVCFLN